MSIIVSVELSELEDPNITAALSRLLMLLGDDAPAASVGAQPTVGTQPTVVAQPSQVADAPDGQTHYERFLEALPDRSRRFVELVYAKGTLTIDEAMEALDITIAKAIGGVTGSIARWAPRSNVAVPYVAVKVRGRRAWRWTGPPARTIEHAPAPKSVGPARPLPAYAGELPGKSQRFLQVLGERGELRMPEVLKLFNLPRPRSVGGIIEPIKRAAKGWARRPPSRRGSVTTVSGSGRQPRDH